MADKVPVKGGYDGSSLTGLAEFASGDTLGIAHGGTGLATIGTNQLVTGNGTSAVTSESNLTFDGTILKATGDLCATVKVVAPALCIGSEYVLPTSDGSAGQLICTDGSGALAFADAASSGHTIADEGTALASRTCLNFVGAAVTATDNSGSNATDVTVCATNALLKVREADGTQCCITLSNAAVGTSLCSDTSPQLGGNLDVNGNSIVSASNGNIPITPNGSGIVILDGICHPTADGSAGQVLCTNGSAALQWATIASTSPGGSNTQVQFNNSSSFGGSANLTWDNSNNRLGIGTTAPVTAFHLNNGASITNLPASTRAVFANTDAADAITRVGIYAGGDSAYAVLDLGRNDANSRSSLTYNTSADSLTIGTSGAASAAIINATGQVGIGTTAPDSLLHLETAAVATAKLQIESTATNGYPTLTFKNDATTWNVYGANGGNGSSADAFQIENASGGYFLIQTGGNVGIGTAAPAKLLHVYGATDTTDGTDPIARFERSGSSQTGIAVTSNSLDGLVLRADSSGFGAIHSYEDLGFYTGVRPGTSYGDVAMRIETNGTIGIGTTTPKGKLHVLAGTATAAEPCSTVGCTLVVESCENNPGIDIIASDSGYGQVIFRGPSGGGGSFNENARIAAGYNGCGQRLDISVGNSGNMATFCRGGSVHIGGSLSKGSGSFRIEHPLESKKDTHRLVHSFIEGPQADLIYRGVTQLVDGSAEINIDTESGMTDGTFVEINRCVQVFTTNETNWDLIKGSVTGNILTIESKTKTSTATISWMVIGERKDKHMFDTEWTNEEGRVIVEPEIEPDVDAHTS